MVTGPNERKHFSLHFAPLPRWQAEGCYVLILPSERENKPQSTLIVEATRAAESQPLTEALSQQELVEADP